VSRNMLAAVDWSVTGPKVLEWLAAEAPRRTTLRRLAEDCVTALEIQVGPKRLLDWLSSNQHRDDWNAIKRTLGAGNGSRALTGASAISSPVTGSLLDHIRADALAADCARCVVCALGPELLKAIADAKRAGRTQREILAALARHYGKTVPPSDFAAHYTRRHEGSEP